MEPVAAISLRDRVRDLHALAVIEKEAVRFRPHHPQKLQSRILLVEMEGVQAVDGLAVGVQHQT